MKRRAWLTTEDGIAHIGQEMEIAEAHYSRCRITDPESGDVVYDGPAPAPPSWWDEHANRLFSVEMLV